MIRTQEEFFNTYGFELEYNFTSGMLISVNKGTLPNGGYEYTVKSITEEEDKVSVIIEFKTCRVCTRSFSSPYQIVGLEKIDKTIYYSVETVSEE